MGTPFLTCVRIYCGHKYSRTRMDDTDNTDKIQGSKKEIGAYPFHPRHPCSIFR